MKTNISKIKPNIKGFIVESKNNISELFKRTV